MRTRYTTAAIAGAVCLAGAVMLQPVAKADTAPLAAANGPAASKLADSDAKDNAKRVAEIPNIRKAREQLTQVAKMLNNDVTDPKGYRHEARDLIDKAVQDLTNEINEYKGDEPAKK